MSATKSLVVFVLGWLLFGNPAPVVADDQPVSFRNDVMALLSRAGCNQGTCHGNANGKGGFKLSLRGQDPAADFVTLSRGMFARRLNPQQPEASLVLAKATAILPHEGGRRFAVDSDEYRLLHRWIAAGAPADSPTSPVLQRLLVRNPERFLVQPEVETAIKVQAEFSDGTTRDVTRLACFESTNAGIDVSENGVVRSTVPGETAILVRYLNQQTTVRLAFVAERSGFVWTKPQGANLVDDYVFARLKKLRMNPSDVCNDAIFVRRVYLDLLGLPPNAAQARNFLHDNRPERRAKLIDELLERPEFAEWWALKWSDLLRNEEKQLDKKGVKVFHEWIRESIAGNKPLNDFARELIAARGSTYTEPPANFYRALREADTRAEAAAQVFLGIRMQCAKCHNHPFDHWTQEDYHRLTAFFAQVKYKIVDNNRKDKYDSHEFVGEQIVLMDKMGEHLSPVTKKPLEPRFPGAGVPTIGPDQDRLQVFAEWVAEPSNPLFARAQVNRIWYFLMGRGIVDPDDDFRLSNPPANPELLDALTRDFVAHKFDLKHSIRTIMNSRTYQVSSRPNETNGDDTANFSHALIRSLQAEQLLDAIAQATGVSPKFDGFPPGTRAGQLPGAGVPLRGKTAGEADKFMRLFGKPERLLSCDCERSVDTTLAQSLQLLTGRLLNTAISQPNNRLGEMLSAGKSNREILEDLYLTTLCRLPTDAEYQGLLTRLELAADRRASLEDVLWALLNSKEFLLRQ
jgi:Protein of unknown function (DUF1549)/Protein of unknown function (DUF1553)